MSRARHASGGKIEPAIHPKVYEGAGSNVEKEAEMNKGGRAKKKDGGAAEGMPMKQRLDRPGRKRGGRAGADMSPLTTASKITNAGAHKATEGNAEDGP